jgi:hypothetical protein
VRSKLGELLERVNHSNQQVSPEYTQGNFRDYLRGLVPLITGISAQLLCVILDIKGEDIVQSLTKYLGYYSRCKRALVVP